MKTKQELIEKFTSKISELEELLVKAEEQGLYVSIRNTPFFNKRTNNFIYEINDYIEETYVIE